MMTRDTPLHCKTTALRDWPATDREAWHKAISPGDALNEAGSGGHWAPATRDRYLWAYGHWLTFLRVTGRLDDVSDPANRFDRQTIDTFVASLRARDLQPQSIAAYVEGIHNAIWGMVPEEDWGWLRDIRNTLKRNAVSRPTDRSRIHPIDQIYDAGIALMKLSEKRKAMRPLQNEVWYRDGLLLSVGAATVLRRKNLALLELGRHMIRQPASNSWRIAIPGAEVKNGMPVEGILPDSITSWLDRYVEVHRLALLQGRNHTSFWVTYDGGRYSVNSLSGRFSEVAERLGIPMSCHDLRRSAATTIANLRPDLARLIGQLLGHTTQHTSERYYNKAQMRLSSERHGDAILERRRRLATAGAAQGNEEGA